MKVLNSSILSLLLLVSPVMASDPTPSAPPTASDPLTEALPILQAKLPDFKEMDIKEGDHLSDLITRSNGKITLGTPEPLFTPLPVVTASFSDNILYWRLASFSPEKSWADMETQLAQATPSSAGIILDLRSNAAPDDYSGAAQVLGLFSPGDTSLSRFSNKNSSDSSPPSAAHPFHSPIIVLINHQTTGAAEALAACLKADGALVVGRTTAGRVGVFEERKLSSGELLRYFVSPLATKAPQHALPWNQPVTPDISLTVNDRTERGALVLIRDHHVLDVIQESNERHRMSEAALVQGNDPEWDAYLTSLENKTDDDYAKLPPLHDVVLISALDSLKAIQLSQGSRPAPPKMDASAQMPKSLE